MDIISQLQEQVNSIAAISFKAFGTLQRDAPTVQLSPNYPEQPTMATTTTLATTTATDDASAFHVQPKQLSAGLIKAAKHHFPCQSRSSSEKNRRTPDGKQCYWSRTPKAIRGKELKQVQELFGKATDNCLNMKKPE